MSDFQQFPEFVVCPTDRKFQLGTYQLEFFRDVANYDKVQYYELDLEVTLEYFVVDESVNPNSNSNCVRAISDVPCLTAGYPYYGNFTKKSDRLYFTHTLEGIPFFVIIKITCTRLP